MDKQTQLIALLLALVACEAPAVDTGARAHTHEPVATVEEWDLPTGQAEVGDIHEDGYPQVLCCYRVAGGGPACEDPNGATTWVLEGSTVKATCQGSGDGLVALVWWVR